MEDPHDSQGDGDVLQVIARDVDFYLVHVMGEKAPPVVQLEGLDDPNIHGLKL